MLDTLHERRKHDDMRFVAKVLQYKPFADHFEPLAVMAPNYTQVALNKAWHNAEKQRHEWIRDLPPPYPPRHGANFT